MFLYGLTFLLVSLILSLFAVFLCEQIFRFSYFWFTCSQWNAMQKPAFQHCSLRFVHFISFFNWWLKSWNFLFIRILMFYFSFFIISGRRRACLRENDDNKFKLTYPRGSSHYFRKCKFNIVSTIILYLFISTIGVSGELKIFFNVSELQLRKNQSSFMPALIDFTWVH